MAANKCVVTNIGGISHPYNYCIAPLNEVADLEGAKRNSKSTNLAGVTETASALFNYTSGLIIDASNITRSNCRGVLGNKYIIKTGIKCRDGINYVHKYVDNTPGRNIITGDESSSIGILPAALGSATSIHGGGLMRSIVGESTPNCVPAKFKCHIIDNINSDNTYIGDSNTVHISESDYNKLKNSNNFVEPFENMYESLNKYLDEKEELNDSQLIDNLEYLNMDKNIINSEQHEDKDILIDIYYILLTLFFVFISYKLLLKK